MELALFLAENDANGNRPKNDVKCEENAIATDSNQQPTRATIDAMPGLVLLEFGAEWCGHCQAIRAQVSALLLAHPTVRHIKIADGRGLPLGRSFRVKLWPTLVFLKDGQIMQQLVRPDADEIGEAFGSFVTVVR